MIEAALRAAAVPPFHAMAMSREAAALEASGRRILHLEVGQPSTPLPQLARDAVRAHLDEPLGYTNAAGLHPLRRRLADRYDGVDLQRILVVAGASAGFTLAFLTLFEPGARVGVLEPGYPCYRNALLALGMQPVPIPVGPASRWAPTPADLDAAGHLDGLVLASPSNPTGTVLRPEALAEITAACRSRVDRSHCGRDLPRHRRRPAGAACARPSSRGVRGQQLLEVLVDDRVARRLGGRTRLARRHRRAAATESVHLRAARLAGGGACCARCDRRTRRPRGALPQQPLDRHRRPRWPRASPTSLPPTARSTCTPTCPTSPLRWASTRCNSPLAGSTRSGLPRHRGSTSTLPAGMNTSASRTPAPATT